jgi:hypothetical protein
VFLTELPSLRVGVANKVVIAFVKSQLVVRLIGLDRRLMLEGHVALAGFNLAVSADKSELSVARRGVWME